MIVHVTSKRTILGQRIYDFRRKLGLSLAELARMVNLTPAFLCDVEHGNRGTTKLKEIEEALHITDRSLRRLALLEKAALLRAQLADVERALAALC